MSTTFTHVILVSFVFMDRLQLSVCCNVCQGKQMYEQPEKIANQEIRVYKWPAWIGRIENHPSIQWGLL